MTRGRWRWAGLAATAPCVLLLAALPVGFAMELGKQTRLRITNRSARPLRVTPLRTADAPDRFTLVVPSLHPLLPLPALRAADHPLPPGASLAFHHRARRGAFLLAVREPDGPLRVAALPAEAAGPDSPASREIVLLDATPLGPAPPGVEAAAASRPQILGWALLLAAPLGSALFLVLYRNSRPRAVS